MIQLPKIIEPKVIINSFVGIAESWDFLELDQGYLLPHNVKVSTCDNSIFHGMATVRDSQEIFQVDFGYYQGYSLSQIVLCREKGQIPVTSIKNEFIAAIDDVLDHVGSFEGGSTFADESCRKYSQVLSSYRDITVGFSDSEKDSDGNKENNEAAKLMQERFRLINGAFVKQFGYALSESFLKRIQIIQEDSKTFTVCKRLETNCDSFEQLLPSVDVCKFKEISIKLVKEYSSSDCVIFWDRAAVVAHMQGQIPSEEYYPGLLNNLGNFKYKLKPTDENSCQVVKMEFSSGLFNQLKYSNKMFQINKPLVTNYLAGGGDRMLCGKSLSCVRHVLHGDADKLNPHAQFGAVLTSREPTQDGLQQILNSFKDSNRFNPSGLFRAYSAHDFKRYIDATMLPPFRTLQTLYQDRLDIEMRETDYVPTIESLKLAPLCEAIICFGIYGTARVCAENPNLHSEQLLCDFGLLQCTFTKGELFQGLGNLNNVGVVDDKLVILDYSKVRLYVNVFYNVDMKGLALLDNSLTEIKNWHMEGRPLKKIAKLFWLAIEKFVMETNTSESRNVSDLWDVAYLAKNEDVIIKLMSCREFLEFLNSQECPSLPVCTGFLKIIRKNLDEGQFTDFLEVCARFIEDRLYYPSTVLLFPVRVLFYNIIVLPFRVTRHRDFDFMDEVGWQLMHDYYETIYLRFYRKTIPRIQELLVQVQKDNRNDSMKLIEFFMELDNLNVDGVNLSADETMSIEDESEHSDADNDVDMGE